jgi:hypothetical protein
MRKLAKWAGITLGAVIGMAACGVAYLRFGFPKVSAASNLKVQASPELLARGKYLAEHVTVCVDCHSTRDWGRFAGPLVAGTEGKGGERFGEEFGFPGTFYARNITPAALSGWSDGEIVRAFTAGVSKDGRPYFPVMPYPLYGHLCERDVHALVAYVRALAPIDNAPPPSAPKFPFSLILRTIPHDPSPWSCPDVAGTKEVDKGKYLAHVAGCIECHTKQDKGKRLPGMDFAGGFEFALPTGTARSANLTPHAETGLGNWTRAAFVRRFKDYASPDATPKVEGNARQTVMPWAMYAGMTEDDLGALFEYLRTVPAVPNKIEPWTAK